MIRWLQGAVGRAISLELSLLRSWCCSPAPSLLWVPPTARLGPWLGFGGVVQLEDVLRVGCRCLSVFPWVLFAWLSPGNPDGCRAASAFSPCQRWEVGIEHGGMEPWASFSGNSPGAVAITTLRRTLGGHFGCPGPIWESLVQQWRVFDQFQGLVSRGFLGQK